MVVVLTKGGIMRNASNKERGKRLVRTALKRLRNSGLLSGFTEVSHFVDLGQGRVTVDFIAIPSIPAVPILHLAVAVRESKVRQLEGRSPQVLLIAVDQRSDESDAVLAIACRVTAAMLPKEG